MCESSVVLDAKGKTETLMEDVIRILVSQGGYHRAYWTVW
ncbi:CooT family nickel-binding protein [Halobacteriota archaeon]